MVVGPGPDFSYALSTTKTITWIKTRIMEGRLFRGKNATGDNEEQDKVPASTCQALLALASYNCWQLTLLNCGVGEDS